MYKKDFTLEMRGLPEDNTGIENENYSSMIDNFVTQRGDNGARLLSLLAGYIRRVTYNNSVLTEEDREEILQEIAIKILNNHKKIKKNSYGWLFRVAYNECINEIRRKKNSTRLIIMDSSGEVLKTRAGHYSLPVGLDNVFNDITDAIDCFDHIFDELIKQSGNPDDKDIYIQYIEGFTNEDIAKKTGRTQGAIAKRLSVLRNRIKELFLKFC